MNVFEFNNRPFLLKSGNVSKRDRQTYNLLAENQDLYYPYEVVMATGERVTKWCSLTSDDVRTLLDTEDTRPQIERLEWSRILESMPQSDSLVKVKRVAPVAHILFRCTLVDKNMYASSYNFMLTAEDVVYLVGWVMDHEYGYDIEDLKKSRTDLYERITDTTKLPGEKSESSVILLTTAEKLASMLMPECEEGGSLYDTTDEFGLGHLLTLSTSKSRVEVQKSILTTLQLEHTACLVINEVESFKSVIGAYVYPSINKTLNTMYIGKAASLRHLINFLDSTDINYVLEKEHDLPEEKKALLENAVQNMKDHKFAETVGVLDELAEDGNPEAMYWLSHRYQYGIRVPNTDPNSKKKYDRIPHDYEKSLQLLKESADYMFPPALYELGLKYYKGDGVEQDYKTAFSLFESSAQQCYVRAMYYVSMCLSKGQGTEVNMTDSIKWCKRGANAGHSRCQYRLASLYAHGCDVDNNSTEPIEPNIAKVIEWCTKSAQSGYPIAQFELAQHYLLGNGVEKDLKQAVSWLQKAAENKLVKAKEMLNELGVES